MTSTALTRRPETIRAEVAADPERRELLRQATTELLDATEQWVSRYVVLPDQPAATATALYALHTWTTDACDATPYLLVVSEEKGSGKTRLLETLGMLVRKPWHTSSTTEVALFRRMDKEHPTLMLDEIDTIFRGGSSYEALRAILNAGNRRGSTVTRCDGRWETREYSTFGPKVLAGIDTGFIPDTILDRSIIIRMRKRSGEQVCRLRPRLAEAEVAGLARTIEAWALVAIDELARIEPQLPDALGDRQADSWEPLLAIAEFAGDAWTAKARAAAESLSAAPEDPDAPRLGPAPSGALLPGLEQVLTAPVGVIA